MSNIYPCGGAEVLNQLLKMLLFWMEGFLDGLFYKILWPVVIVWDGGISGWAISQNYVANLKGFVGI